MDKQLDHLPIVSGNVKSKRKTGKANEIVIPQYHAPEEDDDGNAILPLNFLPAMVDKLPEDWFIRTYPYYKYIDKNQRDKDGNVCAPFRLSTANPANVKKWRELAISVFVDRFTEEGKHHYGLEIAKMAMKDKHRVEVLKDGRQFGSGCTSRTSRVTISG